MEKGEITQASITNEDAVFELESLLIRSQKGKLKQHHINNSNTLKSSDTVTYGELTEAFKNGNIDQVLEKTISNLEKQTSSDSGSTDLSAKAYKEAYDYYDSHTDEQLASYKDAYGFNADGKSRKEIINNIIVSEQDGIKNKSTKKIPEKNFSEYSDKELKSASDMAEQQSKILGDRRSTEETEEHKAIIKESRRRFDIAEKERINKAKSKPEELTPQDIKPEKTKDSQEKHNTSYVNGRFGKDNIESVSDNLDVITLKNGKKYKFSDGEYTEYQEEVHTPTSPEIKESLTEVDKSNVDMRQSYQDMLTNIDDKIENTPYLKNEEIGKYLQSKLAKSQGIKHFKTNPEIKDSHVWIDVKGDGKFKIRNTKEALEAFKKKVIKGKSAFLGTSRTPKPSRKGIEPTKEEMEKRIANYKTEQTYKENNPTGQEFNLVKGDDIYFVTGGGTRLYGKVHREAGENNLKQDEIMVLPNTSADIVSKPIKIKTSQIIKKIPPRKKAKSPTKKEPSKPDTIPKRDGTVQNAIERIKYGIANLPYAKREYEIRGDIKFITDKIQEATGTNDSYYVMKKLDSSYKQDQDDAFTRIDEVLNKPEPKVDITELTPKQYKKYRYDKLKEKYPNETKEDLDYQLESYDTDEKWLDAVIEKATSGKEISKKILDKVVETFGEAQVDYILKHLDAHDAVPKGYIKPSVRHLENKPGDYKKADTRKLRSTPKQEDTSEKTASEKNVGKLANTDDVGGEMFGNRRQTGISLNDVKTENNQTKKLILAQKTKIWKRPDYQALVDSGIEPVIAHSIKQIYDKIATKPRHARQGDKYIHEYVEGVEALRDAVNDLLADTQTMNKIIGEIANKAKARSGGQAFNILEQFDKSDTENYLYGVVLIFLFVI